MDVTGGRRSLLSICFSVIAKFICMRRGLGYREVQTLCPKNERDAIYIHADCYPVATPGIVLNRVFIIRAPRETSVLSGICSDVLVVGIGRSHEHPV